MSDKNPEFNGRFPGVDPIPEPDRPDQAATDMLDDIVTGILENKNEKEIKESYKQSRSNNLNDQ
ncbi:hypothetical protein ACK8P5_07105 [Paenibacillus sp. EC2-1]|uniref:hypothetical protein n=1 Tax=Paenibacillus sp. EC2-1 TaxID=3388665 RepID=UPI003BEF37C8